MKLRFICILILTGLIFSLASPAAAQEQRQSQPAQVNANVDRGVFNAANLGEDDPEDPADTCPPNGCPPDPPSNLTAIAISFDAIRLDWDDVASEELYEVERADTIYGPWITVATLPYNTITHIDTGLNCNTLYYYRVRAYNFGGYSPYSNIAWDTTFLCTPGAPINLVVTATSQTTMNMAWGDVDIEDGYRIERSPDGSSSWVQVGVVSANVTTFDDTGLTCETTYYYRVIAFNAWGDSLPSNVDYDTTFTCLPPIGPPDTPPCISATPLSPTSINVTWCNVTDETGYSVQRSLDGVSGWTLVATVGADVTTYDDTGLSCETTYYYRVIAFNNYGNSAPAGPASATTLLCPVHPPTGTITLTASPISATAALLDWNDLLNEDGYHVERSPTTTAWLAINASMAYTWTQIGGTGADITTYQDNGLTPNTTYCYRVRAYNTGGNSDYSNIACVTTLNILFIPLLTKEWSSGPGNLYSIAGRVTDNYSLPVEGVTISCDGYSTTTGSSGDYVLEDLPPMTCDVTASKSGYTFTPPAYSSITLPPSRTGLDFIAQSSQVCYDAIANGGFEYTGDWEVPITEYTAGYSTLQPHSGARSMRIGILNWWDNRYAYSSARQVVTIPSDAVSAVLTYWLYPISGEAWQKDLFALPADFLSPEKGPMFERNLPDYSDAQYLLVLNPYDNSIQRTLLWFLSNEQYWTSYQHNLLNRYRGQTIKLHWGVFNDGWDGVTSMFVDDISLIICR